MPRVFYYDGNVPRNQLFLQSKPPRRYGPFKFFGDVFMTIFTAGLWLIWVFIREMRRR